MSDYTALDSSPLLHYLFYPRKDSAPAPSGAFDLFVAVEKDVSVTCRFYVGNNDWPWILFFHGNGEIVSDYDHIFPFYHQQGINLVVADYRGYGSSEGSPSFTNLIADAHTIFKAVHRELPTRGLKNELWIMGRSLGSISALELASHYVQSIQGLIIESGFISVVKLIHHLGLPAAGLPLAKIEKEAQAKAAQISVPTLLIHGSSDTLVPFEQAEELLRFLGTPEKQLLTIYGGEHNDVMLVEIEKYFAAIRNFIYKPKN